MLLQFLEIMLSLLEQQLPLTKFEQKLAAPSAQLSVIVAAPAASEFGQNCMSFCELRWVGAVLAAVVELDTLI